MPEISVKEMADGKATGVSVKFDGGQFCFIATNRGILGCGIFDIEVFDEVNYIGALCKGTIEKSYIEPEDLLDGRVSLVSKKAREIGIAEGMIGKEVLEILIK